jgi:glycosyltransferase involved in cell wall biosynthesis
MNIHFFVRTLNDATGGGSHYNSMAYIRALRAAGHTVIVHVFSASKSNSFPSDITPIVHEGWGLGFKRSRTYLAELLRAYEQEADAFFLYAVEFAWGGGLYRRAGGSKPVLVYMDAYLPSMNNVHRDSLKEWIYHFKRLPWDKTVGLRDAAYIDQFLPCSPYIGEEYKKFGFPKDKFTVLPNIVPDKSVPRLEPEPNAPLRILYIGRLIYDKDLLIDSLKSLSNVQWKLTIVGDGPMKSYVEDRVQKEGLPIQIVGWVPQAQVGAFYAAADIFVHPARWPDPAPRTVVDALHARVPMVVPDTGGSSWIAGKAGLVFKTGDLRALTQELRTLIENTGNIRAELVSRSTDEAKKFSEEAVSAQIEKILDLEVQNKL